MRSRCYFRAPRIIVKGRVTLAMRLRDQVARPSGCCRATMAVHALTFRMTINPRTMRGCATTISDNTFADRRE